MGIRVCTWVAACVCACMGLYLSNNALIITGHLHTVEVIEQNNLSASRQRKCAVCFCCPGRVACRLSGSRNVWEWRGCGCSALRAFSCWCASTPRQDKQLRWAADSFGNTGGKHAGAVVRQCHRSACPGSDLMYEEVKTFSVIDRNGRWSCLLLQHLSALFSDHGARMSHMQMRLKEEEF